MSTSRLWLYRMEPIDFICKMSMFQLNRVTWNKWTLAGNFSSRQFARIQFVKCIESRRSGILWGWPGHMCCKSKHFTQEIWHQTIREVLESPNGESVHYGGPKNCQNLTFQDVTKHFTPLLHWKIVHLHVMSLNNMTTCHEYMPDDYKWQMIIRRCFQTFGLGNAACMQTQALVDVGLKINN